jgi:hypothetical protein
LFYVSWIGVAQFVGTHILKHMLQVCLSRKRYTPKPDLLCSPKFLTTGCCRASRPGVCPERPHGPGTVVVGPVVRQALAEASFRNNSYDWKSIVFQCRWRDCRLLKKTQSSVYLIVCAVLSEITPSQLMQVTSSTRASYFLPLSHPCLSAVFPFSLTSVRVSLVVCFLFRLPDLTARRTTCTPSTAAVVKQNHALHGHASTKHII